MTIVCNLYKDTEITLNIPNVKVINTPYDFTVSTYKNIGLGGIDIEEELFKYDSVFGEQKYTQSILIWDSNGVNIKKIIESIGEPKPDEIYLESIKPNFKHSWFGGHKNAVVTLSSAIMSANTMILDNPEKIHNNIIPWMGNRIGLNLFEI